MKTIEIDFDIHKLIEAERQGFSEPEFVALRRLLNLPPVELDQPGQIEQDGRPFIQDGVSVPHGSKAKMDYLNGTQVFEGQFLDGKLVVNGQSFTALSSAASAFAKTKNGTSPSLNGWNYWKAQLPGETKWRALSDMRVEAHQKNGK